MVEKWEKTKRLLCNERGQGLAEYGLLIALIAVAVIVALTLLGKALSGKFKDIGTEIEEAKPIQ